MEERALSVLEELVGIQSVNPAFSDEGRGEHKVADYVATFCERLGLEVRRREVLSGRENVIAELRVGRPEAALLFEAHMDTVALGGMRDPLVPKQEGGRLYGRGACDTKGSLAAMLVALEECAARPEEMSSDVILCATVDEEYRYRGVLELIESGVSAAGAIVGEPTGLEAVVAHKGCARFRLTTRGRAAHSSVPHEGINAIYRMMPVLAFLRDEVEPSLAAEVHPLCGSPTVLASTIEGGTQINTVPETCSIQVDRRVNPGEEAEVVFEELVERIGESVGEELEVERLVLDWPLDTPLDAPVVGHALEVLKRLDPGKIREPRGVAYGSDASKLQQLAGIPSLVFGPGYIEQAHSSDEWVDVRQVGFAARFYREMMRTFGQREGSVGALSDGDRSEDKEQQR